MGIDSRHTRKAMLLLLTSPGDVKDEGNQEILRLPDVDNAI